MPLIPFIYMLVSPLKVWQLARSSIDDFSFGESNWTLCGTVDWKASQRYGMLVFSQQCGHRMARWLMANSVYLDLHDHSESPGGPWKFGPATVEGDCGWLDSAPVQVVAVSRENALKVADDDILRFARDSCGYELRFCYHAQVHQKNIAQWSRTWWILPFEHALDKFF